VFQESFKGVLRKFQSCFKELSRVFQESFKGVLRKFKGLSRNFHGCFEGVLRVFHEKFMEEEVSWMFQRCFMIVKGVSQF